MRAAVYDRFWHSQGGGERHCAMVGVVLARSGAEVDLLTHQELDKDALAEHLGLDLSGVGVRLVPDKGDHEVAVVSADYDLFVNGSYMSRLAPRARRNAYLCYFPTPFDADLTPWRRTLIRALGRHVRARAGGLGFGTGWFPPEGGRRRQWIWTSGDAVLAVPPGRDRTLRFELGGPGLPEPVTLTVTDETGGVLGEFVVTPDFRVHRLVFPDAVRGTELHLSSPTFVPARTGGVDSDRRTLGVAVSRMRMEGATYGPARGARPPLPVAAARPDRPVVPVGVRRRHGQQRVHPRLGALAVGRRGGGAVPADLDAVAAPRRPSREPVVLSVGRFFSPGLGHAKRQLEMVEWFGRALRSGALPEGWRMHVVGGCEDSQRPYLAQVEAAAAGLPVTVVPNAPRAVVDDLLSTASVFWSATGYGEDEQKNPWASEHFGMTTVEAMAGGCVPVVIDRAGQKEIVREGLDGYRWSTPDELLDRTARLARDEPLRARLAATARERAGAFDEDAFAARWREIAARSSLL